MFSGVRWRPVLLAGIVAAVLSILAVFLVVAVYATILAFQIQSRPDQEVIKAFAVGIAAWLRPTLAVLLTLGAASMVAHRVQPEAAFNGLMVGLIVAVLVFAFVGSFGVAQLAGFALTVGAGWAASYISPVAGALLQGVIDVAVILNALRALRA
jgi:hypothetical protein